MIIVYTTKDCPWCKMAKEFLKSNNISYKEMDVGKNEKAAQEMVRKSGHMGVPVIDVNGNIIIGFDEEKLRKTLKL
ncbi:glutathione S-transferase N-terminal domain-containing protein [Candidatus Pacearchaeota archaeon]|nr:glutathione S-transferase N-terminal domain-containing protein [Candidatus Pacearchaeota archaeon]